MNETLILTSAHCVVNGQNGYIIAGDLDITASEANEQNISVCYSNNYIFLILILNFI